MRDGFCWVSMCQPTRISTVFCECECVGVLGRKDQYQVEKFFQVGQTMGGALIFPTFTYLHAL